jgi:putative hydrolase of the HAD superfamily
VLGSHRLVFWDFDGTLARRKDLWSGALLDACRFVNPSTSITVEQLRPHLRGRFPWDEPGVVRPAPSAAEWWAALHPVFLAAYVGNGLDMARAEAAASRIPIEFTRLDAWTVIDGATEALRLTQTAGYRNMIVSNHVPELPDLVDGLGLAGLIEQTITSAAVGAEKPNPAIFRFAMAAAGVSSTNEVWMIGDNPIADVEGAQNVGIAGLLADGAYPDAIGMTVLDAARHVVSASRDDSRVGARDVKYRAHEEHRRSS